MRATFIEAVRDVPKYGLRESAAGWWEGWPCRRRAFWALLLFEPGQGWLRWKASTRTEYEYIDEGLEQPVDYPVAPPLRRLYWYLREWFILPRLMLVGVKPPDSKRYRFAWEEAAPCWVDLRYYVDPERKHELWQRGWPGWKRGRR